MLWIQGGETTGRGAILGRGGETAWGDAQLLVQRRAVRLRAVAHDRRRWSEGDNVVG
jgi:hypothetical protein